MKSFNLTRYSVTHPIGIFMIVLFFVVLGLYSYWRIGVELYPNINVPYVIVSCAMMARMRSRWSSRSRNPWKMRCLRCRM